MTAPTIDGAGGVPRKWLKATMPAFPKMRPPKTVRHVWAALSLVCLLSAEALALPQGVYEIGPGDVLHVVILGQAEISGDYAVDRDGMISFPFLGKTKAAGLSAQGLERKLTTALGDGYLKRPQIAVTIKESERQKVFVSGEVRKPGAYSLKGDGSLRFLLQTIGDLTLEAGHEVIVVRPPKASGSPEASGANGSESSKTDTADPPAAPGAVPGSEVFRVNLRDLLSGNPDKDFRLEAGDSVFFPRAAQVYVTGNVARGGPFRYEEGMTVHKLLALAGGITARGSTNVKIVRIVGGKKKEFKASPTDVLQPEDVLVVPERFF